LPSRRSQKLQNAVTIAVSLMAHIARILRRRTERKMEDVLGED